MQRQPNPMARPVNEKLPKTSRRNHLPGGSIHRLSRHPRANRPHRGRLGVVKHLVHARNRAGATHNIRARAIRMITRLQRTPNINHHHIPQSKNAIRKLVMRIRTVWPRAHDDEINFFMLFKDKPGKIRCNLPLSAPRTQQLRDLCMHAVDCFAGSP